MSEVDQRYLESSVGIPVHPEGFDGHRGSQVFSVTYICKPAAAANLPKAYGLLLNNVGGGYDAMGFADLG